MNNNPPSFAAFRVFHKTAARLVLLCVSQNGPSLRRNCRISISPHRTNMNRRFLSVLLAALLLLCANDASACLCPSSSVKDRVKILKKEADAIFTGKVKAVIKESGVAYKVVFKVRRSWKEKNIDEYTRRTTLFGCGVRFAAGKTDFGICEERRKPAIDEHLLGCRPH
jgi:hypothetical protein